MAISLPELSFAVACCWAEWCCLELSSWGFDPVEYPASPELCRESWCYQDWLTVPGVGDGFAEFGEVVSGVGEAVPGVGEAVPGVGEAVPGVGEAVLPEFGVVVPGLEPVCPGFDIVPGVCPLCAPAPACPALDPVEEPALEPVDPAEPADPAEPDCPVSATTQHVKSNKTAIIEIFVFMGPPSLQKEVTPIRVLQGV